VPGEQRARKKKEDLTMGYRIGIVKEKEPGGCAQVVTERKSVCGECRRIKLVCYGCLLSPKVVGRVANPIGAEVGDTVKVHLPTGKLLTAAGMFYLMPIFLLMAGVLSGAYLSDAVNISETAAAIWGAAAGLSLGMILAVLLGRVRRIVKILQPSITSVISPKGAPPA